jgi:hypothetical protein
LNISHGLFTPLEIMPHCSAAGLDFIKIPAGFNASLEFLTGFTEEGMGSIKIFTKAHCPKCPAAKEIGTVLKKEGVPVLNYDLDTIDGLAEASFYSILSTPSIVIEDERETEVISWRGVVPSLQEVKQHLFK